VTMDKLLSIIQKGGESVLEYIKRFCNLSLEPYKCSLAHVASDVQAQLPRQSRSSIRAIKAHT